MFKKTVFALLSAAFALSAHAQEDELSLQLNGFVDSYHALQEEHPHKIMSSRTRLRLEMRANYGEASLFSSVNLAYNSLIKDQSGAFLREAYFDYAGKYLEVKAGRQIITWGVADGLRLTDLISPMDYTEFMANDYDDIRVPVNAINLKYPGESFSAELVFVPVPEYFVMPSGEDNPWTMPLPANTSMDLSGTPEKRLKNSEVGGRLRFFLENLDFSLTALRTFNKSPVTIASFDPETKSAVIKGIYEPMNVVGGDVSIPVGELVIRGEVAAVVGKAHIVCVQVLPGPVNPRQFAERRVFFGDILPGIVPGKPQIQIFSCLAHMKRQIHGVLRHPVGLVGSYDYPDLHSSFPQRSSAEAMTLSMS